MNEVIMQENNSVFEEDGKLKDEEFQKILRFCIRANKQCGHLHFLCFEFFRRYPNWREDIKKERVN